MIDVLVPVLGRPGSVRVLLRSLEAARGQVPYRPVFVVSPGDRREREAVKASGASMLICEFDPGPGDYARKINLAAERSFAEWVFLGADDLRFRPGWADAALACARSSGRRVVGTLDLGNPAVKQGRHSTHSLVAASYVAEHGTIDQPGQVLHEGYDHQFCDNELVETARFRGEWVFCRESVVEHLHPHWGKGRMDPTYRRGLAARKPDSRLFQDRRRLWSRRPGRVR